MNQQLRVAVVGAGLMGYWHAVYGLRCGARVVAIIDRDLRAAEALRNKLAKQANVYDELGMGLQHTSCEVVHVCTDSESHVPLCSKAICAGCHVLVEKPVAPTWKETQQIVELAHGNNVNCCAVHQFPFQRGFRQVARQIDQLGEICRISHTAYSAGGQGESKERRRQIVREILPHPLSLFRALLPQCLSDGEWSLARQSSDDTIVLGEYAGVDFHIDISLVARPPRNELVVVGSKATAYIDLFHGYGVIQQGGVGRFAKIARPIRHSSQTLFAAGRNLMGRAMRRESAYPGLRELVGSFYQSLLSRQVPPVSADEMTEIACVIDSLDTTGVVNRELDVYE
jgi:predicted dehydrogenase